MRTRRIASVFFALLLRSQTLDTGILGTITDPSGAAVTGVDGHGRVLIEAGRARHLDYAAPGADMTAIGLRGRSQHLRGTSFAAPLVAARIAANQAQLHNSAAALSAVDAEARSARAGVAEYGRGLLCGGCRTGI